MAKKRRGRPPGSGTATRAAQSFGTLLGNVAAKVDSWVAQRDEIAKELNGVIGRAQGMLAALGGESPFPRRGRPAVIVSENRGRKRRKMSAKARKAISEAQKARWAKQKAESGRKAKKANRSDHVGNG